MQFKPGDSYESLALTGKESFDFAGLQTNAKELTVTATAADGSSKTFKVDIRIDTPKEWEYYENGGILQYVLRQIIAQGKQAA